MLPYVYMNEQVPDLRRVTIEIPTNLLPELLSLLGRLAIANDLSFNVDHTDNLEPSIVVGKMDYDPAFIQWIKQPSQSEPVAIVTRELLGNYVKNSATNFNSAHASRAYNALMRRGFIDDDNFYFDDYGHKIGVKADKFAALALLLQEKSIYIPYFGSKSVELLVNYAQAMLLKNNISNKP